MVTLSDSKITIRTCAEYDIPIESRSCAAYNIPIEKNGQLAGENGKYHHHRTTREEDKTNDASSSSSSSSVVDPSEISTRTIHNDKGITRDQVHEEIQSFLRAPVTLHNERRSFLTMVLFLTRLPVPAWVDLHPGFLMKGLCYMPVVGMLIGMIVATAFDFVSITLELPPVIAAAVSVGAGWVLTGCFHEDGLSDSADGIGGGWTRAQIFKIMTDSRVGTYGCAALGLYSITKVHLLASLGTSDWNRSLLDHSSASPSSLLSRGAGPALVVAHTLARVTAPYLIRCFDYVDDEQGPKSSFYAFMIKAKHLVTWSRVAVAVGFGGVFISLLYNSLVAILLLTCVLMFAHTCGRYSNRVLGGVMGDFLGATICLSELLIMGFLLMMQRHQSLSLLSWSDVFTLKSTLINALEISKLSFPTSTILHNIWQDSALVRFGIVLCVMKAWNNYVWYSDGPPAHSEQTTHSSSIMNGKGNGNSNSVNEEAATTTSSSASAKSHAAHVLSLPTSTFRDRFDAVQGYIDVLAKPVGSLGTLEVWAARLAALQRSLHPDVTNVTCLIFAADHGVAATKDNGGEACSAYPQAVTRSVLSGLHRGVAGASVLAQSNHVMLRVVDVGVILHHNNNNNNDDDHCEYWVRDCSSGVVVSSHPQKLPHGTRNFCLEPALSAEECERCIMMGRNSLVEVTETTRSKILVLGEVGIGNTTSSSALIAALTGMSPNELCGGGAIATKHATEEVILKKISIVNNALSKHYGVNENQSIKMMNIQAVDALAKLGGAEIAALVGALLEASERNMAVLVDGFIVTAAALVAVSISPSVCRILFFASQSAEPGQRAALEKIRTIARANDLPVDDSPVLSMQLRMGEATAALLAVPILRCAAAVLTDMATIQDILS